MVYIADNIASGVDRREIEGEGARGFEKINYPRDMESYKPASDYNDIIFGISEGLRGSNFQDEYVNSLLELFEAYLSYVPSSTYLGEVSDISLFDHSKITASLASSIVLYLTAHNRNDNHLELFKNRHSFYKEKDRLSGNIK